MKGEGERETGENIKGEGGRGPAGQGCAHTSPWASQHLTLPPCSGMQLVPLLFSKFLSLK